MEKPTLPVPRLIVTFTSDTEDNHPSYVPLWKHFGSNYESNPADLKWTWTHYWDILSDVFRSRNIPVTWFLRVDHGPVFDQMLTLFKSKIQELKATGDEIAIHIHTFEWNSHLSEWIQTRDLEEEKKIVIHSLDVFKKRLGFFASSTRMGWNTMDNEIMKLFEEKGIKVDASAISGFLSNGKYHNRDNRYDWHRSPCGPYHPSFEDYQSQGNMNILEIPISTLATATKPRKLVFSSILNRIETHSSFANLLPIARMLNLNPHRHFYISPYWGSSIHYKIIDEYYQKAKKNGIAFLVGNFHACDIFNPVTDTRNKVFKQYLQSIIGKINSLADVDVIFCTLSDAANIFNSEKIINTQFANK